MKTVAMIAAAVIGLSIIGIAAWQSNQPCDDRCQAQQRVKQMWKCTALLLRDPAEAGKCADEVIAQTQAMKK